MFDFLFQNIEISILIFFFILGIILRILINNEYIKAKILGWLYIIIFIGFLFVSLGIKIILLFIFSIIIINEFRKVLLFNKILNSIFFIVFFLLLSGLIYFMLIYTKYFFYLFIIISFSDIIAYFVGKNLTWKKGFTKLSPNKSLSGVIGQILFILVILYLIDKYYLLNSEIIGYKVYFYYFLIGVLAPIGDLLESYFKRNAQIKDMADYIPGHGGILDRVDSIFLITGLTGLYLFFLNF